MELLDRNELRSRMLTAFAVLRPAIAPPKPGEEGWYINLLYSLAIQLQSNAVDLVESDNQGNLGRAAWACRGLWELHYWTRYVLTSPQNARRFHEDALIDYKEILSKLEPLEQKYGEMDIPGTVRQVIATAWANLEKVKEGDKHLSITKIATDLGGAQEFAAVYKVLSKFVHETSVSHVLRLRDRERRLVILLMFQSGVVLIEMTLPQLIEELRRFHR